MSPAASMPEMRNEIEQPRVARLQPVAYGPSSCQQSPANLIASILTLVGLACSSCRPPSDPNPIWVQLPSSQNTGSRRGPLPCTPLRLGSPSPGGWSRRRPELQGQLSLMHVMGARHEDGGNGSPFFCQAAGTQEAGTIRLTSADVEAWHPEPRRLWLSRPSCPEDLDRFRTNL